MQSKLIYDYDSRNLPPDLLAAIGLCIACAAQTEYVVEMAIGGLLGLDAVYTAAVTTHATAPLRSHILKAAAELTLDNVDDLDLLDEIMAEIESCMEKRNNVAHNSWCRNPITLETFTTKVTARGSVDSKLVPMSTLEIRADAAAIYDAGIKLLSFLSARNLFPSLPTISKPRRHKTLAARKIRRKTLNKS